MEEKISDSLMVGILSDPVKNRIIDIVSDKEVCTCTIRSASGLEESSVFRILDELSEIGLILKKDFTGYSMVRLAPGIYDRLSVIRENEKIKEDVREYYGKELKGSKDLKTNACCCSGGMPEYLRKVMGLIDDEILDRFYGCGSPIPELLEGLTVLDLGCGTGRDVYIVSKLVGESGRSIGVDMTDEQLDVAKAHVDSQMSRFGFGTVNVDFRKGFIEDLASAGIPDGSVDVVISNCVINLSPEKEKVFSEIHRVLRKGGELYFSDVFADRRVPQEIYDDPVLHGECLSGAMYVEDFRRMMVKTGFTDFRYMSVSKVTIDNEDVKKLVGDVNFTSRTVRAFKIDGLEDICEDYGQVATYIGGIPGHDEYLDLDGQHRFFKGVPKKVCGNTAAMVSDTRFAPYFKVDGDRSHHYGVFGNCCDGPEEKACCGEPETGSCCCCR